MDFLIRQICRDAISCVSTRQFKRKRKISYLMTSSSIVHNSLVGSPITL